MGVLRLSGRSLRVAIVMGVMSCYLALSYAQGPDSLKSDGAKELDSSAQIVVDSTPIERVDTLMIRPLDTTAKRVADTTAKKSSQGSVVGQGKEAKDSSENLLVDYDADVMTNRGDKIVRLVGNVHFHHNGAIIQCDSAFQYTDNRMDFFGRVVIEKDSAYIYGDRVNYNGATNIADVYAPIVKMMQGSMTLYTYNLRFNTKTSVGIFEDGGVMSQKQNMMEADRGSFDANAEYARFLDNVAMRNESYKVRTDSLGYDFSTERVDFLDRTYIWSNDSSFLMADSGHYFTPTQTYLFTSNAYTMTEDNEMWADTMRYVTEGRTAYMFSNVQILDTANTSVGFGDWAFYDDSLGSALLTLTPSVRVWDNRDTSYLRADTIMMLTFEPGKSKQEADSFQVDSISMSEHNSSKMTVKDTTVVAPTLDSLGVDSLGVDSLGAPPLAVDSLGVDSLHRFSTDSVAIDSSKASITADTVTLIDWESYHYVDRKTLKPAGRLPLWDSLLVGDRMMVEQIIIPDSALLSFEQQLQLDSLAVEQARADSIKRNERERVLRAYYKVRLWSEDYQGVCDSTVSFSVDSTAIMYGSPILWSQANQITAEQIDVYTKESKMDWADFIGDPFIAQQVVVGDTLLFNQASSKQMQTYFVDDQLDYAYMSGNVQNIYYMDEDKEVAAMAIITCAELTIMFVDQEPVRMIWQGQGEGPIYPIEKVPVEQSRFLPGFAWHDSLRPKSAYEICRRIERPSRRAEVVKYQKPTYAIYEFMERAKTTYLKASQWTDRTDVPNVTPEYFIERNSKLLF